MLVSVTKLQSLLEVYHLLGPKNEIIHWELNIVDDGDIISTRYNRSLQMIHVLYFAKFGAKVLDSTRKDESTSY
jgi:hypothetical protein